MWLLTSDETVRDNLYQENLYKKRKDSHWVAAEPPSDGLRWATWSMEIRSASTVWQASKNDM